MFKKAMLNCLGTILICFLIIFFSSTNAVCGGMGTLYGYVFDENSFSLIEDAIITVEELSESTKSSNGGYYMMVVPSGSFTVKVTASGYAPSINYATIMPNQNTVSHFTLTAYTIPTLAEPAGGIYPAPQVATLTCNDGTGSGNCTAIYYTTNGSNPTTSSNIYSDPIPINDDTVLKFFADYGSELETIRTEFYIIDTDGPQIIILSPEDGWSGSNLISITGTADDISSAVDFVRIEIANSGRTLFVNENQWLVGEQTWLDAVGTEQWLVDTKYVQ